MSLHIAHLTIAWDEIFSLTKNIKSFQIISIGNFVVKTSVRNTLSAELISLLLRKFFAHIHLPSDGYLKTSLVFIQSNTRPNLYPKPSPNPYFHTKKRTGNDPALSVLQTEVFTTQLSRQIAEESLSGMIRCFYSRITSCLTRHLNILVFRRCVSALRFSSGKV